MEVTEQHIRHIMLYEYQQSKTATTTVKKLKKCMAMVFSVFESVNDGFANFDKVTSACKMPHTPDDLPHLIMMH